MLFFSLSEEEKAPSIYMIIYYLWHTKELFFWMNLELYLQLIFQTGSKMNGVQLWGSVVDAMFVCFVSVCVCGYVPFHVGQAFHNRSLHPPKAPASHKAAELN